MIYPVIIAKEGKGYIVNVPGLDLYTEGVSMIDAIDMEILTSALERHLKFV